MSAAKKTEYVISEIKLVTGLTTGGAWYRQGQGFDIERDAPGAGYWIKDHRGPKWWIPSTNVVCVKYDVVEVRTSTTASPDQLR
jgi:hypothetical protein